MQEKSVPLLCYKKKVLKKLANKQQQFRFLIRFAWKFKMSDLLPSGGILKEVQLSQAGFVLVTFC